MLVRNVNNFLTGYYDEILTAFNTFSKYLKVPLLICSSGLFNILEFDKHLYKAIFY